jgi:DHA1 family tetracycline resistance protein-like MFS transporter
LTIILTALLLEETVKNKKKIKINLKLFHFGNYKKYLNDPKISPLLWQFFLFLLCHITFTSQFALFTNRQYGMGTREIGFMLAFVGLNSIIQRGILLSKLIDFFGERKLLTLGIISIIIGSIIGALSSSILALVGAMFLFSFGAGVIRPLMIGEVSRKSPKDEQGAVLGVANSLGSIAQIISPLIGGYVLTVFPAFVLPLISSFFVSMVLIFIIRKNNKAGLY